MSKFVSHRILIIALFLVYMISMTALMVWQGVGIAPDRYALVLMLGSLAIRRTRRFLMDWIPFMLILISYDFLRGLATLLGNRAHFQEMIDFDTWIFHTLPTVTLQQHFFNPQSLQWYDYLATIFYFLHFALPLAFGFILWIYNREHFKEFAIGISLLSYAAWATYVIFPAAPPWLANQNGYVSRVNKIMDQTFKAFPDRLHMPTVYTEIRSNPVAAIPSLHAAYPMLVLLFALSFFGLRALFFLPYALSVWISVVYLGEHYVADIVVGVLYAVIFWFITRKIAAWFPKFIMPHPQEAESDSSTSLINS